jgi:hypothetical protein
MLPGPGALIQLSYSPFPEKEWGVNRERLQAASGRCACLLGSPSALHPSDHFGFRPRVDLRQPLARVRPSRAAISSKILHLFGLFEAVLEWRTTIVRSVLDEESI